MTDLLAGQVQMMFQRHPVCLAADQDRKTASAHDVLMHASRFLPVSCKDFPDNFVRILIQLFVEARKEKNGYSKSRQIRKSRSAGL
jgi:hypothetical protein